jgi:hypothetical protein
MNKRVIYITSTTILVLEILAGAFMDLAHFPLVVQEVRGGAPKGIGTPVGLQRSARLRDPHEC